MKILIRNRKSEKWQLVQSAAYAAETELQRLLAEEPSLISINDVREGAGTLVAAIREFPLDIGTIDILGFTATGDIAIIECKLASNEEIKRKVISQVFEYGANLWEMSYETLDQKVTLKANKNLADLVRDSAKDPGWDEEAFRSNIVTALQNGNFILMIVVDEISDELGRIIRFINFAGKPAFSLSALEMQRFQHGDTEMLVPHVFGSVEKSKPDGSISSRKKWDETSYFEDAQKKVKQEVMELIKNIYDWSLKNGNAVRFGSGGASGSFTFYYEREGKTSSVFSVFTNGIISINFGYMAKIFTSDQIEEFSSRLSMIPSLKGAADPKQYFFNVGLDKAFAKPANLEAFKQEVLNLKEKL